MKNLYFIFLSISLSLTSLAQEIALPDIVIKGAMVYDGSEGVGEVKDVGIKGSRIVFVGKYNESDGEAVEVIHAEGYILTPGFIDPHTHIEADLSHPQHKSNLAYLMQGVTTVIGGNDGSGPLPVGRKLEEWERNGIGTNAGLFVGHGSVRRAVLGNKDISPSSDQLAEMEDIVAQSMKEGAMGLSTGLFYAPGSFATKDEVVALAKVAHQYDGIYDTHMRDESSYSIGLINSIKETLEIGEESGIPIHFSHIKALGADVWGKSKEVIELIVAAQERGLTVTANQYPYEASRTSLIAATIPRWAEDGGYNALLERMRNPTLIDTLSRGITENIRRRGGPESLILSTSDNGDLNGHSLKEISEQWALSPTEVVLRILQYDSEVRVVSFNMREDDIENFMKQPWVMTGSDGVVGHPRKYGSFTKKITDFSRDNDILPLNIVIHSSSGKTAETLGLRDRGFIKEGYYADIAVFKLWELKNNANYDNPSALSEGMAYVIINGQFAIKNGKYTGALAGKALRKN
ncbi:MAG TPA: D-aminoacylase [Anditalea sp.]|nr:D-aminoacylase [Anditalea sp.]